MDFTVYVIRLTGTTKTESNHLKEENKLKVSVKTQSTIEKCITKSIENERIMSNWGNTSYNVLGMQHTKNSFLIWSMMVHVSVILCLSYQGLY